MWMLSNGPARASGGFVKRGGTLGTLSWVVVLVRLTYYW